MGKFEGINRNYSSKDEAGGKTPEERQKELKKKMDEFLAKGGKVTKLPSKITKEMLRRGKL
jgi:hypothetical protein